MRALANLALKICLKMTLEKILFVKKIIQKILLNHYRNFVGKVFRISKNIPERLCERNDSNISHKNMVCFKEVIPVANHRD